MKTIVLPDLTIETECDLEITMMVLGGRKPATGVDENSISTVEYGRWTAVWIPVSMRGILPDKLVGDGDSASPEAWKWAADSGADVRKFDRDKDLTDFQIALGLLPGRMRGVRKLSS